jgi:hypothetical protein
VPSEGEQSPGVGPGSRTLIVLSKKPVQVVVPVEEEQEAGGDSVGLLGLFRTA